MSLSALEVVRKFEGFKLKKAKEIAEQFGWTIDVVKRNGKEITSKLKADPRKINVEVEKGTVTHVRSVG